MWVAHMQACIWGLVSIYMGDTADTWVNAFKVSEEEAGRSVEPITLYIASLYWSIMTLTSIGYGGPSLLRTASVHLTGLWHCSLHGRGLAPLRT